MHGLDLTSWASESEEPEYTTESDLPEEPTIAPSVEEIDAEILKNAIEKAKVRLNERNRFEYEVWLRGKLHSWIN